MLKWLLDRYRRTYERPPQAHVEIADDGFAVVSPDGARSLVRWSRVVTVVTYKNDNFSTDEIIIAFELAERPGELLEVSEEWRGFHDLFPLLEEKLGLVPNWYEEVMQPPFARNHRVLLQRTPPPPDDASGSG